MPTVDDAIPDSVYLADGGGTPITGATLTGTATLLGTLTTAAVTITEESGGWYGTSFTPAAAGRWRLVVTYDDGTTARIFTETYDVASADITSADAVAAEIVSRMGRSIVTVAGPLATDGTAELVRGDAATLNWSSSGWSIDPAAVIELTLSYAGTEMTYPGDRVSATSVSVSLTEVETLALTPGRLVYRYVLRDTTADVSLAVGLVTVRS